MLLLFSLFFVSFSLFLVKWWLSNWDDLRSLANSGIELKMETGFIIRRQFNSSFQCLLSIYQLICTWISLSHVWSTASWCTYVHHISSKIFLLVFILFFQFVMFFRYTRCLFLKTDSVLGLKNRNTRALFLFFKPN